MIVLWIVLIIIVAITTIVCVGTEGYALRKGGIHALAYNKLSWPAWEVMKSFKSLPKDRRPSVDMLKVVNALDIKHGGFSEVNKAYDSRFSADESYGWDNASHRGRVYHDYFNLYNSMEDVKKAVAEQQLEFAIAGMASDLDKAKDLARMFREEAATTRTITKQVLNREELA